MKIIVDADACPVKEIIINIAREYQVDVVMVCSYAHFIEEREGVTIIQVDQEPQAADIAVINRTAKLDIVVTQDYGLAAIVLGKGAVAISPRGMIYANEKMDEMLTQRHYQQKFRKAGGRTKGPKPHSNKDDDHFELNLRKLLDITNKSNYSE